jgi:hypothetical protein
MQPTLAKVAHWRTFRHTAISDQWECEGRLSWSASAITTALIRTEASQTATDTDHGGREALEIEFVRGVVKNTAPDCAGHRRHDDAYSRTLWLAWPIEDSRR